MKAVELNTPLVLLFLFLFLGNGINKAVKRLMKRRRGGEGEHYSTVEGDLGSVFGWRVGGKKYWGK